MWTKTFGGIYGEEGNCVQQTTDGGFVIVGSTNSFGAGEDDIWFIKTDENGNTIWTKTYGDSTGEVGYSVQQTNDGGYIIVGYTDSFGSGEDDVWLIKTDENGDSLWTKTFGGSGDEEGFSVDQTVDGGYIIAGYTTSFGSSEKDVWLIKTDTVGNLIWHMVLESISESYSEHVHQTSDSGYVVAGTLSSPPRPFLIKTNSSGDTLWTRILEVGTIPRNGKCVIETNDNGYIFLASGWGVYLFKLDDLGNTIWMNNYEKGWFGGWGSSLDLTNDGGYIISGKTESNTAYDVWVIKTNEFGDTSWTKTLGGVADDWEGNIQQTSDNGYTIVGSTYSFGAGASDIWLIKLKPDSPSIIHNYSRLITEYVLTQNYPNPFNPTTKIKYSVPQTSNIVIKIFDILGNEIETLVNEERQAGTYEITWYVENLPSGVYFYQLQAGNFVETKKMILMK
jgi:hypothetical protein